jgi:uncharacterized protein
MINRPCPICRKPRNAEFTPFCSSRCRDVDLGRWFGEGYALPGPPADPPGDSGDRVNDD